MKKFIKFSVFCTLLSVLIVSCKDDDDDVNIDSSTATGYSDSDGVFVLNEGSGTGSISYIDSESDSITNDVYSAVNGYDLGEYPEAMAYSDDYLFVTVTTSSSAGYVLILDRSTMEEVGAIENLTYPREVTVGDNYAYVSNGTYAGEIYAISLTSLAITDTIPVGYGPEKMIIDNNKLYVANSGGYSTDSTVMVVDLSTNTVSDTIQVRDCPKDMVMDADGNLWVYCGGSVTYNYNEDGEYTGSSYSNYGISVIASDYSVSSYDIDSPNTSTKSIAINGDKDVIYYTTGSDLYSMNISNSTLPTTPLVESSFYGIDVDPETGYIWCCDVQSYSESSDIVVYDTDGNQQKSYTVGITPNSCIFN